MTDIDSADSLHDEGCSKSSVEDGLECPVCWEGFNNGSNLPYVLWCGHSLCKSCLLGLQWATVKLPVVPVQLPLFVSCPWCQFLSCRLLWKGKLKYPCKNFFLLWLVESLKGEAKHFYDGSTSSDKLHKGAIPTTPYQHAYDAHGNPHTFSNQVFAYPARQVQSLRSDDYGFQESSDVFFLQRWFKKVMGVCAHLMAKFMLLLLVMFILFCALPFSTIILVAYFAATLVFAFPSFLMLYFAFPSLSWLLREIVT